MLFSNALLDTYNLYSFFVRKFPTTFDYWNVEYLRNHQNMVTFIDRHRIATTTYVKHEAFPKPRRFFSSFRILFPLARNFEEQKYSGSLRVTLLRSNDFRKNFFFSISKSREQWSMTERRSTVLGVYFESWRLELWLLLSYSE